MIAERMSKIDSSGIRKVFDLAAKIENPINLSIGLPNFDVPDEIKKVAIESINEGFNRYTQTAGMPELREKMKEVLKNETGKSFDDVMISSGVSGGLLLAFMVLVNPGDEVIIPDPYFVMYKHLVNLLGGVPKYLDTYPDFSLSAEKLEKLISPKTKVLLLNSPSNPTGKVYTKEELTAVLKVAKKHNLLVISDEIYAKFFYSDHFSSPASLYDNVVVLGGFSKTYAMTGWRVGYVAGPQDIIDQMITLQQYTFVCAPSFAQKAALKALDYNVDAFVEAYKKKRDIIYEGLKDDFKIVKPEGAFYTFPILPEGVNAEKFVEEAIKSEVLIIPGNVFSEQDKAFRISFATEDEKLLKGVDILKSIIKKMI